MGLFDCCRRERRKKTEPPIIYTVIYDSENHWSILTQRIGSAWPDVFPFCVFNCLLVVLLYVVDPKGEVYFLSNQGHKFIKFIVAFLIVSRVTMAMKNFNEARTYIGHMYKESRELVQTLCIITANHQDQKSKEWRAEVTYRAMLFLRTSMGILDYPTNGVPNWKFPELNGPELDFILNNLLYHPQNSHYAMLPRCEYEENSRVPVLVGLLLRKSIAEHSKRLPVPLGVPEELKLLGSVDKCVAAYTGIRSFKSTPVPFPLVQMSRTFLFLYLFTVPLVLTRDPSNVFAHCFAVFLLTYGFMGLEVIAIALDDPFGDDDIDFKCLAMAHTAFEDTYLTILDVDGPDWADFLRYRMNNKVEERLTTEQSWLLDSKERFADLMVGKTIYRKETEAQARYNMEQQVIRSREEEKRKKREKSRLKLLPKIFKK